MIHQLLYHVPPASERPGEADKSRLARSGPARRDSQVHDRPGLVLASCDDENEEKVVLTLISRQSVHDPSPSARKDDGLRHAPGRTCHAVGLNSSASSTPSAPPTPIPPAAGTRPAAQPRHLTRTHTHTHLSLSSPIMPPKQKQGGGNKVTVDKVRRLARSSLPPPSARELVCVCAGADLACSPFPWFW